jgi:hypothetical protein
MSSRTVCRDRGGDGERNRPGVGWRGGSGGFGGGAFEDEESEEEYHIEDLTGGAFEDPEKQFNATTLSRKVMATMYELNSEDPVKYSVEALAAKYRVRRQRVSAILVTQGMEAKLKAENPEELLTEIDDLVVRAAFARTHTHPTIRSHRHAMNASSVAADTPGGTERRRMRAAHGRWTFTARTR